MSISTLIIGESGSGKSHSIQFLDPKETFIINVIGKPLPFKGYKHKYTVFSNENPNGNYYASDSYEKIKRVVTYIDMKMPHIRNLIVDDFQYLMANEFMSKALEKGYDKFSILAKNAWELITLLNQCRHDLNCFVLSHSDTDQFGKVKCKTIGKMLDDKVTLEGMFTVVLHTIASEFSYKFLTNFDGLHLAKSPHGMFFDTLIDNNLQLVVDSFNEYYNSDNEEMKSLENTASHKKTTVVTLKKDK